MVERYLLDRSFTVIGTAHSGAGLLNGLQTSRPNVFVIGDRWWPGEYGVLLRRSQLLDDVLKDAFRSRAERDYWREQLEIHPAMLGPLIAGTVLGMQSAPSRGGVRIKLAPALRPQVRGYLGGYVDEAMRRDRFLVPIVSVSRLGELKADESAIAVRAAQVVGVVVASETYQVRETSRPAYRGGTARPNTSADNRATANKPATASTPRTPKPPKAPAAAPFIAHPRLDVKGPARPGLELPFKVGFSDRPDPEAKAQSRIDIPKPRPGELLLVVANARGARILEPSWAELRLDFAASHEFKAVVFADATEVRLRVKYHYRKKPVGHIVKVVDVTQRGRRAKAADAKAKHVSVVGLPRPSTDPEQIADLDVILYVHKNGASELSWQAYVPATGLVHGTYYVEVKDTEQFAKQLADLRSRGDQSPGALEELFVIGRRIAECIPAEILEQVLAPALAKPHAPAILIYTDEPFIPWELARPEAKQLGQSTRASLGALARIGRWWSGVSLAGPRSSRAIEHVSAVAAKQFTGNQATLQHAIEERAWLLREFAGLTTGVEAIQPDIDTWLDRPRRAAHLGHIALHGYSDALSHTQGLILADGSVLTPERLAGEYDEGEIPRFDMLFLNACQVGTAGERLGRIAGFPGTLLLGGASGFIGPLWEVEDEIALACARTFYERVLKNKGEVGEALRSLRATPPNEKSITPWAYLFYGHPRLQLLL